MLALIVCALLVGLMVIGIPVGASMGLVSMGTFAYLGQGEFLPVMAQRIYIGTTGFTMLAIPFFILAGNLMNTGGITDRIFGFARSCCGHWPGGLGQVNIISSVIFSGMSGAAVADAAGLGAIEMKAMDDAGFDPEFSAGITAASSTIGPVIPPSIPFVDVYKRQLLRIHHYPGERGKQVCGGKERCRLKGSNLYLPAEHYLVRHLPAPD